MYKIALSLSFIVHAASAADLFVRLQQGVKGTTFTLENMVLSCDQMPVLQNFFKANPEIDSITIAVTDGALQPRRPSYDITPGSFPDIMRTELPNLKDITLNGTDFSRFSVPPLMSALVSKVYLKLIKFPHVRQKTQLSRLPLMNDFYPPFIEKKGIEVRIGDGDLLVTHLPKDANPTGMISETFLFDDKKLFCTNLFSLHTMCLDKCCYPRIATFFKVNPQIESILIGIKPGQLGKLAAILEVAMCEYKLDLRELRIEGEGFSKEEIENLVGVIADKSTISIIQMDGLVGYQDYMTLFDNALRKNSHIQRASFGGYNIDRKNGLGIVNPGWHL